MTWGAFGSALGSLASSVVGSIMSSNSAKQQLQNQSALNKQSYKYTKKLQDSAAQFNERMMDKANEFNQSMFNQSAKLASTAHQIEVQDLKDAGLNPILSATGGNGASVVGPMQSAQASVGNGSVSGGSAPLVDKSAFIANLVGASNQTKQANSAVELNDSQIDLNGSLRGKNNEEKKAIKQRVYNETISTAKDIEYKQAQIDDLKNQIKNRNDITKADILYKNSQASANSAQVTKTNHEVKGSIARDIADAKWIKAHPRLYSVGKTLQMVAPGLVGGSAAVGAGTAVYNAKKNNQSVRRRR